VVSPLWIMSKKFLEVYTCNVLNVGVRLVVEGLTCGGVQNINSGNVPTVKTLLGCPNK